MKDGETKADFRAKLMGRLYSGLIMRNGTADLDVQYAAAKEAVEHFMKAADNDGLI